jgi:hypothetical protein
MGWNFIEAVPEDYFDVIIASLPCTDYCAEMTCRARDLEMADQIVQRTIDILTIFNHDTGSLRILKPCFSKGDPL